MNQEQLSQSHVRNPYKNPETSTQYGSKGPLDSQRNRENQNSRDHDNRQNLKIGIRDIDEAVLYYFKEVIRPTVVVDSSSVEVPVVYVNSKGSLEYMPGRMGKRLRSVQSRSSAPR